MSESISTPIRVTYRQQYRRCGKAGCSRCTSGQPGHGPYWYAYWREGGRLRSRYLGKEAPAGTDADATDVPAPVAPATRADPAGALRVRTLGGFAVWQGEAAIPPEAWTSHRAAALFKCLLGAPRHRLPREQAIELLWPEAEPEAGAANLRTTIHRLRRVLDGPGAAVSYLRSEGELLVLAPAGDAEPVEDWLDATTFARAARAALAGQDAAACRAALALYGGEYLPDDPYEAWAAEPREALRRQYLDLLPHLAHLSAAQGELEEAEACLRQVLAAEAGHEEAAGTLMSLLATAGRRSDALRVYQTLATSLEELDVAPDAEIQALRAQLLAQEAAPVAAHIPPRQAQAARLTNLPVALTSFVGRAGEVSAVRDLLAASRLVTLTGAGGCGKTRLALEVAGTLVDAYPDGVWLVELAALADPALVPQAVAGALGVAEQSGRPLLTTLQGFLHPRQVLLVLDNCEHLIQVCAELSTTLLQSCPHLRVLATSREGLEVAGEQTHQVPSLAVPDPAHLPPLDRLRTCEAVQLFLERARARRPGVTLTAANAPAVAAICARLDGLPLAIELAAARVQVLPVDAIAARLDDRFRLLTAGPRTALPRQQTLRATLDWSYELLQEPERVLLRRLAVFSGGWTLEAAEAICTGGEVAAWHMMDLLTGLVNKSLVLTGDAFTRRTPGDVGAARYHLLETIRQYAQEKLTAAGEMAHMCDCHLQWCATLAEQAEPEITGPDQAAWLARLEQEHDNLRAALHWAQESSAQASASTSVREQSSLTVPAAIGLRLAGALWWFWYTRGHMSEGRAWLERLLAEAESTGNGSEALATRAKALQGAGQLAWSQGHFGHAEALLEECVVLYRRLGDTRGLAAALHSLGLVVWAQTDHGRAITLQEDSLALYRELGDTWHSADALLVLGSIALDQGKYNRATALLEESLALKRALGDVQAISDGLFRLAQIAAYDQGDYARAAALHEESLALRREVGYTWGIAASLMGLGEVAAKQGEAARAATLYEECLALYRQLGDIRGSADTLHGLASVAVDWGECDRAATLFKESFALVRKIGSKPLMVGCLEGLARVACVRGRPVRAVQLLGAGMALRQTLGIALRWTNERVPNDHTEAATRSALGDAAFMAAWEAGQRMPLEQAIAMALEEDAGQGIPMR